MSSDEFDWTGELLGNGGWLPTFTQICQQAHRQLGDVEAGLRSDWRPGTGPNDEQAERLQEARRLIAVAKDALNHAQSLSAQRRGW